MENNENQNEEKPRGIPLAVPTYEDDGGKKGVWIAFFILAAIGFLLIQFCMGDDKPKAAPVELDQASQAEKLCKDKQGRPKAWACQNALSSKGFNVSKYVSWGGAGNGKGAAICTATDKDGEIIAFDVIFDEHCEGIKVELSDF